MLNCGIYCIKNLVNEKHYVGKSINIKNRWIHHRNRLKNNKHSNNHLQSAYNLYGSENFIFFILIYCERDELGYYEGQFKKYLHAEYNIEEIGEDGEKIISEETKKKMSESKIGHPGTPLSEETKQKISEANSKSVLQFSKSGELIKRFQRIIDAEKETGIDHASIGSACSGRAKSAGGFLWCFEGSNTVPVYEKPKNYKPVVQFSKDGMKIKSFEGAADAEKQTGISGTHITAVCLGKRKVAGGYLWRYEGSENPSAYTKSIINNKPVIQFSKDGIEINRFQSATEAEKQTGIDQAGISSACWGKAISAGGYLWRFENSDIILSVYKDPRKKSVIQYSKDGIEINRFESTKEAERQTGIPSSNISIACSMIRNFAGGYVWKFAE